MIKPLSRRRRQRLDAGFTLAEVLAAMLFMAIVIPVAIEGLHIAGLAGAVAERKGEAARVAQQVLNDSLVTTNWDQAVQNGTILQGSRQFQYSLQTAPWTQDPNSTTMREVTVTVTYTAQNREYSVRMSTLADSAQNSQQSTLP